MWRVPNLRCLSADCSDHVWIVLWTRNHGPQPRFRFEAIWPKLDGFLEVLLKDAWICPLSGVDACRELDLKLRRDDRNSGEDEPITTNSQELARTENET